MATTVLLVDDEPDNVELLTRRLTRKGFVVVGVTSAADALAAAATRPVDVVLMDLKMPVMDGFEATRRLKADPATAHLPVIALTAHALQEDRERALAAGAIDYESKPVDLDRLVGKVNAVLAAGG
jgi:CheY-like chemotaxis protein